MPVATKGIRKVRFPGNRFPSGTLTERSHEG